MIEETSSFEEEAFGILTDDDLYLDCIMLRPPNVEDDELRGLHIWVPKAPLTKSSVIACARHEVASFGEKNRIAHLVFDLRGTGGSERTFYAQDYRLDLEGIRLWAEERFGKEMKLRFFGLPTTEARVNMLPLRPGVVMETYLFTAPGINRPTIIYLSMYGNFSMQDEQTCVELANAGYNVYGLDPYRYLLHASTKGLLEPEQLWNDVTILCQLIDAQPIIIGRRVAAGLALLWTAGCDLVSGVIACHRAQAGLAPPHIFADPKSDDMLLTTHLESISNRPAAFVTRPVSGMLQGGQDEIRILYSKLSEPRRLEQVAQVTPTQLLELVAWVESNLVDGQTGA